jgi:hypothetical protein
LHPELLCVKDQRRSSHTRLSIHVAAENSRKCPDAQQYYGVIVNGVGENVLIGAYRFPNDENLIALDASAKAELVHSVFSLEPILFGKWRD